LVRHFLIRPAPPQRHLLRALLFFVFCSLAALPALAQSVACSEFYLENGLRVLISPRPGCGAIHAAWFLDAKTGPSGRHSPEALSLLLEAWSLQADFMGASGLWAKAGPYGIGCGHDLPASELETWCQTEFDRINLAIEEKYFQDAKARLSARLEKPSPLAELFSLAASGGGAKHVHQSRLDTIAKFSMSDIQALAWELAVAERATVVLIGDVEEDAARDALEGNFAMLPSSPEAEAPPVAAPQLPNDKGKETPEGHPEATPQLGQKVEIQSASKAEALLAWQMQPSMGGEKPSLNLFAEILTGSKDSWLFAHLVKELGCSTNVRAFVETADVDAPTLFIIQADLVDGHTLEEVEKAIAEAMQVIEQDKFEYIEINRAANRLDAKYAERLGDAAYLAQTLIDAQGSAGDWWLALNRATFEAKLEPDSLTHLLKPVFAQGPNYTVLAKLDPLRSPRTPDHARLIALLENLQEKRGRSREDMERAITDALRQYGQMPFEMRKQMLSLLESEATR